MIIQKKKKKERKKKTEKKKKNLDCKQFLSNPFVLDWCNLTFISVFCADTMYSQLPHRPFPISNDMSSLLLWFPISPLVYNVSLSFSTYILYMYFYFVQPPWTGSCTPNQKLACFVLYLKIINNFLKNNYMHFMVLCPRNSKKALKLTQA